MATTIEFAVAADPFKGNVKKMEMSRYIDLDIYHSVERTHPFYEEMVEEIHCQIGNFSDGKLFLKVMEIGPGTGLLTAELLKHVRVQVDAVEIDEECYGLHKEYIDDKRCTCILDDAVRFCREENYDVVVSAFAHDHIHFDRRFEFSENIKRNLKTGGIYIMGGEVLPYFKEEVQRKEALYAYHCYIIEKALTEKSFEVAQIEINALKSGLEMAGDYKRHEKMFEDEMASSGLKLINKKKIGPLDLKDVGGVFVYVYQR